MLEIPTVRLASEVPIDRNTFFRHAIPEDGKVLEIGGSYNPIIKHAMGFNSFSADHASQEYLIEKYTKLISAEVAAGIEPVDFISEDGDLEKAIPREHWGTFDVCISSHNIEHIPNPIAQLQAVERLLTPDGYFLMAVPDKRECFDLLRPISTTASWVEAFRRGDKRHSVKTRFEYEAYVIGLNGKVTWDRDACVDNTVFASGLGIRDVAKRVFAETGYVDAHAWVFTPSSFILMIYELQAIGLISFLPTEVYDNKGEFLVCLRKMQPSEISNEDRMRLMKQACLEQVAGLSKIVL